MAKKPGSAKGAPVKRSRARDLRAVSMGSALLFSAVAHVACKSGKSPSEREQRIAHSSHVRPQFVRGPSQGSPIAPFVSAEVQKSRRDGGALVVYVGATWCEPCKRFHHAVEAGALDGVFPGLRLIEFDLDVDRDALEAAGYSSRMIPLFAIPRQDGRASERRLEGSIKGEAAVKDDLVPRLRQLLSERG